MENFLTPQITILMIAGSINLAMSIFIFSRGIKNKINLYFSIVTFCNFLWAASLLIGDLKISYQLTRFSASLVYPIALGIVSGLFYFAVYFPYKIFNVRNLYRYSINFFIIFFTIYCTFAYKLFVRGLSLYPELIFDFEPWAYALCCLVLITIMFAALSIFFIKYKLAEGFFRLQLKLVLIASIIGTIAGIVFNLFFMFSHEIDYDYLGPLFTLFINFIVLSFIIMPKDKINN